MDNIIFLDIDGCLSTNYTKRYNTCLGNIYIFGKGHVKNFNKILELTKATIVLTSSWRTDYTIEQMKQFFVENGVNAVPQDYTKDLNTPKYVGIRDIDAECRAMEINDYIKTNNIIHYAVIDDIDMTRYFGKHFVRCGAMGLSDSKKVGEVVKAGQT